MRTSERWLKWVALMGLTILMSQGDAQAGFMILRQTPYDKQMRRVSDVIESTSVRAGNLSMEQVNRWMREVNGLRYVHSERWHLPSETLRVRSGDCKDKAVLLLSYLKKNGNNENVRFVIGRRSENGTVTHAWVEWYSEGHWIILDPTFNRRPLNHADKGKYQKKYVYVGGKKYAYLSDSDLLAGL